MLSSTYPLITSTVVTWPHTDSFCWLLQSDDMCASPATDFDFVPPNLHTYVMTQLVSITADPLPEMNSVILLSRASLHGLCVRVKST